MINKKFFKSFKNFFLLSILVVVGFISVVITKAYNKKISTLENNEIKIDNLNNLNKQEEEKNKSLKEKQNYMPYEDYIEDIARDELGLIKDDEIILRPKKDN